MNSRMDTLVNRFNKKYSTKKIQTCMALKLRRIVLSNYLAHFCCDNPDYKKSCHPLLAEGNEDILNKLNKDYYIQRYIQVVEENQTNPSDCKDCPHLQQMEFEPIDYENFTIGSISFTTFHTCNLKCVYCTVSDERDSNQYDSFVIGEKFLKAGLIDKNTNVIFSLGEPVIHPKFSEMLNKFINITSDIWIFTNGVICSEDILSALKKGQVSVNISVDAGTRSTYAKVKGKDTYDLVWNTIKRYCEAGNGVYIKYIVFSYNSHKTEIDSFIIKCLECGVNNVLVSPEQGGALYGLSNPNWTFGENELSACRYLVERCIKNNILVNTTRTLFTMSQIHTIMKPIIYQMLKEYIEEHWCNETSSTKDKKVKICIFGNGIIGNRLYQLLLPFYKELSDELLFCDNDMNKQVNIASDARCISVQSAAVLERALILVPNPCLYTNEAVKQLEKLGFHHYILIDRCFC